LVLGGQLKDYFFEHIKYFEVFEFSQIGKL
jgi:hypothetical protein